jgi:hypothetical protein
MQNLCRDSLGFPQDFYFETDLDEVTENLASFRSLSKMSACSRDMALTQGSLALHFNKWLDRRFELPLPNIRTLATNQRYVRAPKGTRTKRARQISHELKARPTQ